MKLIFLFSRYLPTLVFLGYLLWTVMAMAATMRSEALVTGDSITLGDIFADAGPVANRVVMAAPAAGRSVVLDTATLARLARGNGLNWQPTTGTEMVKVERASQRFDAAAISEGVIGSLTLPASGIGTTKVQLDNPQLVLHAPLGTPAQLAFSNLSLDANTQRFAGLVQVKSGEQILAQSAVAGRVVTSMDVPVLTRPMRRDEVISATDITWQPTELTSGNSNVIFNAEDMIGKSPRTNLRPGVPVRMVELLTPPVISRGQQVTMIYQVGRLTITALGRALGDATTGNTVRVVNLTSSRTVEGVAEGPGVVRVGPAMPRETAQALSAPANIRTN